MERFGHSVVSAWAGADACIGSFRYFHSSRGDPACAAVVAPVPPSLRNVEDLLSERGIDVRHEAVRHWRNRFDAMRLSDTSSDRTDTTIASKQARPYVLSSRWICADGAS
jgi:hypothetical protein